MAAPAAAAIPPDGPSPAAWAAPQDGPSPAAWAAPQETKSRRNPIVFAALAVAGLVIVGFVVLTFIGANLTPYDQASIRVGQRLEADPAFKAKYGDIDHDKAAETGIALVRDGVNRVDDPTQLTLFRATSKVIDLADPKTCAAIAQGSEAPDTVVPILKQLDQPTLDAYFDATATAALASVHADPVRAAPTDEEQTSAGTAWTTAVGADAFQKDLGILQSPTGHTDADVCAAERELIHAALQLDDADRSTIIRIVYTGQN
ncbi:MAG: hypothetical protein ACHQ3P_04105 [Candidatus Limnocylindrales bacterium]